MLRAFSVLALSLGIAAGTAYAQDAQSKDQPPTKHRPTAEEVFKTRDKNQDGKLSLEEFLNDVKPDSDRGKGMVDRFKAMDTNHDGFVTPEEMKTLIEKHAQDMAKHHAKRAAKAEGSTTTATTTTTTPSNTTTTPTTPAETK